MSDKAICKWSKSAYQTKFELLLTLVSDPKYICTKCGRAAAKKKVLCKPKAMSEPM
ncbi:hypothetical protein [Paraferrimonas haliotis]|uniref:Uncharacterized protein n=1 Tax=Paraferrimonas haliotis TaxID=2013866 RepID=A0AA37TYJ3_9GAMM|nr:hypothetical protein [Paraferrimonas haliotis]GLS84999.1 hypothetical protein GCM10007894_29760 [Paraferrimonas haliotis]